MSKKNGEGAFLSVVNPQHAFKAEAKGEKSHVGKSNRRSTRSGRRASLVSSESLRNDSSRTIELIFHDYIGPCTSEVLENYSIRSLHSFGWYGHYNWVS